MPSVVVIQASGTYCYLKWSMLWFEAICNIVCWSDHFWNFKRSIILCLEVIHAVIWSDLCFYFEVIYAVLWRDLCCSLKRSIILFFQAIYNAVLESLKAVLESDHMLFFRVINTLKVLETISGIMLLCCSLKRSWLRFEAIYVVLWNNPFSWPILVRVYKFCVEKSEWCYHWNY